jgi:hypothetical protein
MVFGTLWSEATLGRECASMHTRAQWWTKLSELAVPFDRRKLEADPAG